MPLPDVTPPGQVRLLGAPESNQTAGNGKPGNRDWRLDLLMSSIGKEKRTAASQAMQTLFPQAPRIPFAMGLAMPKTADSGVST